MDFPDENEEFELMYEKEMEDADVFDQIMEKDTTLPRPTKSKKCLDFTSPSQPSPDSARVRDALTAGNRESTDNLAPGTSQSNADDRVNDIASRLGHVTDQYDASKRKFNELFGDVADINFDDDDDDLELASKKQKRETDDELIQRILLERRLNDIRQQSTRIKRSSNSKLNDGADDNSITLNVPRWPFVPMTSGDGQRMYVRLRTDDYVDREVRAVSVKNKTMGLLPVPYESVRRQAEVIIQQKLDNEDEFARHDSDVQLVQSAAELKDGSQLWVDKFKPKRYVDLLSDDSTNRILLQWLKLWDKVVFNRVKKERQKRKISKENEKPFDQKWNRFSKKFAPDALGELDSNGCPQQKMALLCGPPGLGKTTLAHLLARHAGYNVVEMNASDERSPEAFLTALQAATQMRAVLGEKRPNCLVLDEIDGAPAASIELLVKFATTKDVGKARGKKKGAAGVLKRPIICICNDAYVPALRSLRQLAFIVHFPPTESSRIAVRLLDIARKQHIKTDLGVMLALAEKSQNDIRSCVSILHFFKTKGKENAVLKRQDILQTNVGQKDVQKGLFEVWQAIFQIQRSRIRDTSKGGSDDGSLSTRMQKVLQAVHSYGDYDRLTQGVFENYPQMNVKDSYLEGIIDSCDWLCTMDVMNSSIYEYQNFVLMAYLPYAFVSYHFNFSSLAWPKLKYPSAAYEASMKQQHSEQVMRDLLRGMTPSVRSCVHSTQLLLDTLPSLVDIMVPTLRPVSTQLYSRREKAELQHVVNIMIDFSLNYVQERTLDGRYEYRLDPNLSELVQFPGSARPHHQLSYAGKQLVAQEFELEKMRRVEARAPQQVAPKPTQKPAAVPSHLQSLTPKLIASKPNSGMTKDFFGRMVVCKKSDIGKTDDVVKSDVWFHYKEGYSNAVQRKVRIKDLL